MHSLLRRFWVGLGLVVRVWLGFALRSGVGYWCALILIVLWYRID